MIIGIIPLSIISQTVINILGARTHDANNKMINDQLMAVNRSILNVLMSINQTLIHSINIY